MNAPEFDQDQSVEAIGQRHRRWLLVEQTLVPSLLNVGLNAGIAWLVFRKHDTLFLWGESSVGSDVLITGFLLPFLICLINSSVIRRQVRSGKVPALGPGARPLRMARFSSLRRSLVLAVGGVVMGSLPLVGVIGLVEPLSLSSFVGLKAVWAGVLAAVVSPVVAWWALVASSDEMAR